METKAEERTYPEQAMEVIECRSAVLRMIATGAPLNETLATMLRHVEALAPGIMGSVLLLDAEGKHLTHGAAPQLPEEYRNAVESLVIGPKAGSCGTAAFRGEQVIVEDIAVDPLWHDYRTVALAHGLRACWSTPIIDKEHRVIGTFAIYYDEPGQPTRWHQKCIDLVTDLASIAICRDLAETSLRASELRHRRLIESDIVGVIVARLDGSISEANDWFLKMVGYERADLEVGRLRWDKMTPEEWQAADASILERLAANGACPPIEKEYIRKDGTRVPILAAVASLEGTPDYLCIISDLSEQKLATDALKASQASLAAAQAQAHLGSWELDLRTRSGIWSAELFRMLRYDPALGAPAFEDFLTLVHPEDRPRLADLQNRIADETEPLTFDYRTDPATGPVRHLSSTVHTIRDADGRAERLAGTTLDVTKHRRAEEAIQRYETIFRQAGWGMAVVDPETHLLTQVNPAFARMHDYAPEEMIGMPLADTLAPEARVDLPSHVQTAHDRSHHVYESLHVRKDGTRFPCETDVTAFKDEHGKVTFRAATFEDITERNLAEDALRDSEAKFRTLFEQAGVGVAQIETGSGQFIRVNRRYGEITGYSAEYLLARDFQAITHPDDRQTDLENMRRLRAGEIREFTMEKRYLGAHGQVTWVNLTVSPMWAPGANPDFHIAVIENITKRKSAEAALSKQAKWNDTLLDTMVDGFILADLEGAIQRVNSSYCAIIGRSAESLVGMNIRDLEVVLSPEEVLLRIKEFQRLGKARFETRHRHGDGSEISLLASLTLVGYGDEALVAAFVRDISGEKKAERALRDSEERFRLLAQQAPVGIFQTDAHGDCTYANAKWCELSGLSAEQASGQGWAEALHPEDREPVRSTWYNAAKAGAMFELEYRFLTPQGKTRWLAGRALAQQDASGEITGYLGTVTDITSRRRAEKKLSSSRDQLRALLSRLRRAREEERIRVAREVHDELGQLLTGLKMDVRWLERKLSEPDLPPSLNPLLDRAVAASELADATIATVQKIAAKLRPGALDQLGLAAALAQEARRFEERCGVACGFVAEASWSGLSTATETELFYIAQEALTNVARHADASRVEIILRRDGERAVLEISDDGVGLTSEARRASSSLGLLGMEERAAQCRGTLHFTPLKPHGTRVTVRVDGELNR